MVLNDLSLFRPRLALTLGDPAGIGAEISLKALSDPEIRQKYDITIIGDRSHLHKTYHQIPSDKGDLINPDTISLLDLELNTDITLGKGDALSGEAAFLALDTAITQTLQGNFDAIVTAPIAKFAWQAAGYHYAGQTEMLAERSKVSRYGMLFVGQSPFTGWTLRTLLATTHIPLSQISTQLTPSLMSLKLELLIECLQQDFGIDQPHITIAGLNPHSGEKGQLGTEESDWLNDWLIEQKQQFPAVKLSGLIPPDTMWINPGKAWFFEQKNINVADAYLALYHDQGLIPVKLMAFDQAINTTIGLPFIRTSPDHGTAFDIAGQGTARCDSLKSAIHLAAELATQRINRLK